MDFVPTGVGGRLAVLVAARMLERNAVAQQDRVRRVVEAAVRLPNPGVEKRRLDSLLSAASE